jgi:hypothetical protein
MVRDFMTTQPDLFSAPAARADGIQRADDHADGEWKEVAYNAVLLTARMRLTFTADDVWDRIEDVTTHEPSALGPVMLRASRKGCIVPTGRYVPTRNARRHRDLKEWRSA